jgi:hypothetical protein
VAVGDPGVMDVFDTKTISRLEIVPTEKSAHTQVCNAAGNKIYVFLLQTYPALVFVDA